MKKLLDFYLNNALFLDTVIITAIWLVNYSCSLIDFLTLKKSDNIDIISDMVSASISLAGFILASLTVIASMRSNITNRPPEATRNPLEMFFSDHNYNRIVQVFKDSIIELVLVFVVCYTVWLTNANLTNYFILITIVSALTIIILSVCRTLLVLFTIIKIDRIQV